jgi:methionine synthase I (cobalamin-dependent)
VAEKPANEKLWAMIIAQAKAKYSRYPNPAASHWVHEKYVQSGGKFIDSNDPVVQRQKLQEKQFNKQSKDKKEKAVSKKKKAKDKRDK